MANDIRSIEDIWCNFGIQDEDAHFMWWFQNESLGDILTAILSLQPPGLTLKVQLTIVSARVSQHELSVEKLEEPAGEIYSLFSTSTLHFYI